MNKVFNMFKTLINSIFKHHCPDCRGVMTSEFLDMEFDSVVYRCTKCNKEWI